MASETLQRKCKLAEKSFLVGASQNIQRKCWEAVRDLAFEECEDKIYDRALKILTLLEI